MDKRNLIIAASGLAVLILAFSFGRYLIPTRSPQPAKQAKIEAPAKDVAAKPAPAPTPVPPPQASAPKAPAPAPKIMPPPPTTQPVPVPQAACVSRSYKVVRGDSLWRIARREWGRAYFWPVLHEVNKLRNPNRILIGQVLVIPCLCNLPAVTQVPAAKGVGQTASLTAPPPAQSASVTSGPSKQLPEIASTRDLLSLIGSSALSERRSSQRSKLFFDVPSVLYSPV